MAIGIRGQSDALAGVDFDPYLSPVLPHCSWNMLQPAFVFALRSSNAADSADGTMGPGRFRYPVVLSRAAWKGPTNDNNGPGLTPAR